jgi:hypothetical protein
MTEHRKTAKKARKISSRTHACAPEDAHDRRLAFDSIDVGTHWVHGGNWPDAHDIATQRSQYYDGRMMSGATGEHVTPGYAVAQMR